MKTAYDKIWRLHTVADLDDGRTLLYIDRHLTHEVTSPRAYAELARRSLTVRRRELTIAVEDHILSTRAGRDHATYAPGATFVLAQRRFAAKFGVRLIRATDRRQGIVHVIAPELGLALPGTTIVCGDSHTCTLGGVGAVAFGIGTSDIAHVLATQTLALRKARNMRIRFDGLPRCGVDAKDLILYAIGRLGVRAGTGFAVEFGGAAIADMCIDQRQTVCNMAIEMGARVGFVPADDATLAYLRDRPAAPDAETWDAAVAHWRSLASDAHAEFERDVAIDAASVEPQVTWGTTPQHTAAANGVIPDPAYIPDAGERSTAVRALEYMQLRPGTPLTDITIQHAFIGSCNGARLHDLRTAARVLRGRKVATGVRAMVVPGSSAVKRAAEDEGLDRIFLSAGFEWRESACSMCAAVNDDVVPPYQRCISTTNRNFEGRQGRDARTHLASAASVAAAAVEGRIVDPRSLGS